MTTPRASARPGRLGWSMLALALLVPIAAGGGGLAIAPLVALAALVSAPWTTLPALARRAPTSAHLGTAFLAWVAVSLLWSIHPGTKTIVTVVATTLTGALLIAACAHARPADQIWVRRSALALVVTLLVLLLIEATTNMALNRLAQPDTIDWVLRRNPAKGLVVLAVLIWPIAILASQFGRRGLLAFAALTITVAVLGLPFAIDAVWAATALASAVFLIASRAPRATLLALGALVAVGIITAPWLVALIPDDPAWRASLPFSWADRLHIWDGVAARIQQQPIWGWGLDASRAFNTPAEIGGVTYQAIPLHPHNAALQIWLETGVIGAALAAAAIMAALLQVARTATPRTAAATAAMLTAFAVFSSMSFGIWQEWWLAVGALAIALLVGLDRACAPLQATGMKASERR